MSLVIHSCSLPHFNDRPAGCVPDTLVVHSMYLPEGYDAAQCIRELDRHQVAAHYLIDREGILFQLVPEEKRAWHAGESRLPFNDDHRERVNDFSIGVELVTDSAFSYMQAQYETLSRLVVDLMRRHSLRYVIGHDHIAPGRKVDPGATFDWRHLRALSTQLEESAHSVCFPCDDAFRDRLAIGPCDTSPSHSRSSPDSAEPDP
jgi:N-acetyl-anhydromuramoyl-L-alanine amidase